MRECVCALLVILICCLLFVASSAANCYCLLVLRLPDVQRVKTIKCNALAFALDTTLNYYYYYCFNYDYYELKLSGSSSSSTTAKGARESC